MEIAILGLGCFWGPEIKFGKLNGVIKTEVGYCGGNNSETNYKEVCTGTTNHAEVVKLDFDPKVISYEKILKFFFEIHNPTTLNSQGSDFVPKNILILKLLFPLINYLINLELIICCQKIN